MNGGRPARVKPKQKAREQRYRRKVNKLLQEIREIEATFYGEESTENIEQRFSMLERKRDDVVRAVVLQLHTAIEDILDVSVKSRLLGVSARKRHVKGRNVTSRALNELLKGGRALGFESKLRLLRGLGAVRRPTYKKLIELNQLRNKCSHNWLLNTHIRKGVQPRLPKRPLLQFRGRNLHNVKVLQDSVGEYGALYVRLFGWVYT
jgi:hypothetical protein